ncbi:MAG: ATP-binding protein, partial [Bdellovibrionota bacterium]
MILVEGEPGSGKSRLVSELLSDVRAQNGLVLRGKASASNSVPFSVLREALDRQLARMQGSREKILKAAGSFAPLLKRFSPAFSQALSEVPDSSSSGEVQDAFYTAIAEFIAGLASQGAPVAFFIDDVQWLDEGSRQVLVRLAPLLYRLPLLIACSSRSDAASVSGRDRYVALVQRWLSLRLQLGLLPESEIAKIISATLGGYEVESSLVHLIAARANGSPLAVGEYIRAMLDAGLLRPKWGTWHADSAGLEKLELPTDVIQLIVRRIADLSEGTKVILETAALLGSRFPLDLLAVSSQATQPALQAAIQEATRAHLLENAGKGDYVFVHDRVQEALLSLLTPEETRVSHQRIALAMDAQGAVPSDADRLYALARHFAKGQLKSSPERALAVNYQAGLQALENFANEEAYSFFGVAVAIAKEFGKDAPAGLYEHLGIASTLTNRKEEAVASFEKGLSQVSDPLARAILLGRIARIYVIDRRLEQSKDYLLRAMGEMHWRIPESKPADWARAAGGFLGGYILSRLHLFHGAARGKYRERLKVKSQLYELCQLQAYFGVNYPLSIQMSIGPWRIHHLLGHTRESCNYYSTLSIVAGVLKRFKSYERLHALSKKIALDLADPNLYGRAVGWGAIGAAFMGIGRDADTRANQALEEYGNVLPMDTMANIAGTLIWSNVVRGFVARSHDLIIRTCRQAASRSGKAAVFDEKDPEYLIESWRSFEIAGIAMTRSRGELATVLTQFESKKITTPFTLATHYANRLLIAYEHGDFSEVMKESISRYQAMRISAKSAPISARHFFIFKAYIRLEQALGSPAEKLPAALAELEHALQELS